MTQDNKQTLMAQALAERAHDLLISLNFAQQQIGYIHTFDANYGEKVEKRTLLEVEIAAAAKRKQSSTSHHKYIAKASKHLHSVIETAINKQIDDFDTIYSEVVGIQDSVPAILDLLCVRSASVGRLEPLVNDLSWLGRELVALVNLPQYRKKTSKGTTVTVDSPKLALRYLGLENLQTVVPTFSMRHWMPHSTEPFTLMKRKMHDLSMTTAIAAKELAPLFGANENHAFTLGMLLDLGKIALARLYLRTFEKVWQSKVQIARDKQQKDLHTALLELSPDPLFLRNLMLERSAVLTRKLIEKMELKYLPLNAPMEEYAQIYLPKMHNKIAEPLPMTQVMVKAYGYAQYLVLKDSNLIEDDEAEVWFSHLGLTAEMREMLEKCSFHSLQLKIL
ncbi:HDOD domain-containing protein [Pseudoalteromonas sp. T1lg65]|uniref:HDOD domain-containing protein n=1 Tax=Pseudoalteromonas sp. T1lg65 TaxID=2077101 RepID=UPI003F7B2506